jgi:branched-chain amino acid transport system permease protein
MRSSAFMRQRLIAWVIFLALLVAIPWPLENIAPQVLARLCLVGIYAMIIMGLDLLLGYTGQLNLGQQGFFAVGAYTTAVLTTHRLAILPLWLGEPVVAMIMGIILVLLIGLALGIAVLRTAHFYQAMVTLAFGMIIFTICMGWREVLGGPSGIVAIPPFSVGPLRLDNDLRLYYLIWALLLAILVFSRRLTKSRWGLACQALRSDEGAASVMGINVYEHKLKLFLLSAVYASIAGSLYAHFLRIVTPYDFSLSVVIMLFLGLFFGGVHTLWGAIVGAALLQFIPEAIGITTQVWPIISELKETIYGLIFIIIIFYMPRGVVNAIYDIIRRWKSWREAMAK